MKSFLPVVILAFLWALTGAMVGVGIDAIYGTEWVLPCGALNVMIGLSLLLFATRNETTRKIFYEGPSRKEESSLFIAILWALPVAIGLVGVIWWLLGKVLSP